MFMSTAPLLREEVIRTVVGHDIDASQVNANTVHNDG